MSEMLQLAWPHWQPVTAPAFVSDACLLELPFVYTAGAMVEPHCLCVPDNTGVQEVGPCSCWPGCMCTWQCQWQSISVSHTTDRLLSFHAPWIQPH
jgi:hypothetical protein